MLKNMDMIDKDNYLKYACEYSEGNKDLEKILKILWENGIKTVGCCTGHIERNKKPYIGIYIGDNNLNKILILLSNLDIKKIDISFLSSDKTKNYGVTITSETDLFKYLVKYIEDLNNLKKMNEMYNLYKVITLFLLTRKVIYLNFRLKYKTSLEAKIVTCDLNIKEYFDPYYPGVKVGFYSPKSKLAGNDIYQHKIGIINNKFLKLLTVGENREIYDKIDID